MTDKQQPQRDAHGRFVKGVSGNPKGTKSLADRIGGQQAIDGIRREITPEERDHVNAALLKRAARYALETSSPTVFVQCANIWLMYNLPKPPSTMITRTDALGDIDDETARQIVEDAADYLRSEKANDDRSA